MQSIKATIESIRIDDLRTGSHFPYVLYPTALIKPPEEKKPFLDVCVVRRPDYSSIDYFSYLSVGLQSAVAAIDIEFLLALTDLAGALSSETTHAMEEEQQTEKEEEEEEKALVAEWGTAQGFKGSQVYFQCLQLHPIAMELSFTSSQDVAGGQVSSGGNVFKQTALIVLKSVGATVANVAEAPLHLNSLVLFDPFMSRSGLISLISKHYGRQVAMEIYKILGSVDILGNPAGLLLSVGTGVYDFFYAPIHGATLSPAEFGKGVAMGTASLLKNTVSGAFDTVTKVTGAVGKGVAALTMDKEYTERRRKEGNQGRPRHAGEGFLFGLRDLGRGVAEGVSGLVTQPLKGAEEEGIGGFFRGMGRGIVGVAAKPVVGVMDLAARTTEGVRNTATYFDDKVSRPYRFARHISSDGIVRSYNAEDAFAQHLVRTCEDAIHQKDDLLWHARTSKGEGVVISNSGVFCFGLKRDVVQLTWYVAFSCLENVNRKGSVLVLVKVDDGKRKSIWRSKNPEITLDMGVEKHADVALKKIRSAFELWNKE